MACEVMTTCYLWKALCIVYVSPSMLVCFLLVLSGCGCVILSSKQLCNNGEPAWTKCGYVLGAHEHM